MKLSGIIGYPVTPFTDDESAPDLNRFAANIELLLDSGVDAIAPLGSTGESAYLTQAEWQLVAEAAVKIVNNRVPVIIGISELTTAQALAKARFARQVGADAIMVIPVSYWKLTNDEIFAYYHAIDHACGLPIMVYNNPATSGVDMSPELIVRMFREIPSVTMVKESSGDIQRMHRIRELSNAELPFYNGSNPIALEALVAGAAGWCTAAPNLLGKAPKQLYQQVQDGNLRGARELFYRQLPLLKFIVSGGLPKMIKAGFALQNLPMGQPRKPLAPASAAEQKTLTALLENVSH